MAWVKIDDQAPRHHKMLTAGPAACWLWVCGIAHCQSQLSDGFIPDAALQMIGVAGTKRAKVLADVLVSAGLFDRVPGGYHVHDYFAFNASKDEARASRADLSEVRANAGRVGGLKSGETRKQTASKQSEANRSPIPSHPIPSESPTDSLTERAGRLLQELYPAWYAKWRNGAKLRLIGNSLEFQDALSLVRLWDDARLEQLARIVLTTDEAFIASTDRGFKIFALKSSWADDRLRQIEAQAS